MKNIILLSLLTLTLFGCGKSVEQAAFEAQQLDATKNVNGQILNNPNYQIITLDNCEYILYRKYEGYQEGWSSGFCHKGNCKFCIERNQNNSNGL